MTLKEKISKDRILAIKEKNSNKKNVLSVLLGELDRIDKNPTEDQIIKKIKGLIESNILTKTEYLNVYLEIYLPKMLDDSELENIIKSEILSLNYSGMKDMGKVMNHLSNNYTGKYNGKKASEIAKKYLMN